jgi:hypothetical protein
MNESDCVPQNKSRPLAVPTKIAPRTGPSRAEILDVQIKAIRRLDLRVRAARVNSLRNYALLFERDGTPELVRAAAQLRLIAERISE